MPSDSDGDRSPPPKDRKKRKLRAEDDDEAKYKPYTKPGYKRCYPDNSNNTEFPVYVESTNRDDKIGNKNPLLLSKIFKLVKGIHERRRINANKIMLVFKQAAAANNFLTNDCLSSNDMRAYIPASSVESVGVVRFIPKETSNMDLYTKLSSDCEIVSIRRFMKKIDNNVVPLATISITFVGTILPQYVFLDNWRCKVFKYIPPVLQCYKCMKFNHSAKYCRNDQICSKCTGNHIFKDCTSDTLKCNNCGGDHVAISMKCPIKAAKLDKLKNINYARAVNDSNFPALPKPKAQNTTFTKTVQSVQPIDIVNIINNSKFLESVVNALVALGNSNEIKTTTHIKETLLKYLKS